MAEIGRYNKLRIEREVDFGVYLDGENLGEILMPLRYLPESYMIGDEVDVFISLDSEDRLVATTEKPLAMVGEFAYLEVVSVTRFGAFLDWGMPKDLFVPFREQRLSMEKGRRYVVRLYVDSETDRIVGTAKFERFLDNLVPEYEFGAEVDLLIYSETSLGYNAIIDNTFTGVIYRNEVFKPLNKGERMKGFIKKVRDDYKIDLMLTKPGYRKVDDMSEIVLNALKKYNGYLALNDNTNPELIYKLLGMSKKSFKKAIGLLYKDKIISINEDGIRLLEK